MTWFYILLQPFHSCARFRTAIPRRCSTACAIIRVRHHSRISGNKAGPELLRRTPCRRILHVRRPSPKRIKPMIYIFCRCWSPTCHIPWQHLCAGNAFHLHNARRTPPIFVFVMSCSKTIKKKTNTASTAFIEHKAVISYELMRLRKITRLISSALHTGFCKNKYARFPVLLSSLFLFFSTITTTHQASF